MAPPLSLSASTVDPSRVRQMNSALVLRALRRLGQQTRAQLAKALGLNRSTVTHIVRDLVDSGMVRETTRTPSAGGRPGILLELDPEGGRLVGVEINIGVVGVVLTNFLGHVVWSRRSEIASPREPFEELRVAEELVQEALGATSLPVLGIGLAVAALVDAGVAVYSPYLNWRDVPLAEPWQVRFGLPVAVENEANAAALGERYFGVAREHANFVFLSLGAGLAAGIFVNGILLRGRHGFAGQIGHTVRDPNGVECRCGRRGCWVTQVGLNGITRRLREAYGEQGPPWLPSTDDEKAPHVTIRALTEAAEREEAAVLRILAEVGRDLGAGIADAINLLDPQSVVVGGALSPLVPYLLPEAEMAMQDSHLAGPRQNVSLLASAHADHACAIGAAAAVFDSLMGTTLLPKP